jgi:hypothetical protein
LDSALLADERDELIDRDSGLADQGSERALRDFSMIGDGQPTKWRGRVPKDDVTALQAVDLLPEPPKGRDRFATRDARAGAHTATSMTSS